MSQDLLAQLAANRGTFILNNTTEYTGKIDAIVVLEDTVFNFIKINGVDSKTNYIGTPATAVKAGAIITPQNIKIFDGIKLVSGSVILVLN